MGEPVELWRLNALTAFQLAMSLDDHPYRDWLNREVSLDVMMVQSKELTRFWLCDADTQRMQRCWLRSAFEFQQRFHKITDGTQPIVHLARTLLTSTLCYPPTKTLLGSPSGAAKRHRF